MSDLVGNPQDRFSHITAQQFLCNFSVKPRDVEADAHVEGNLAAEISMVALDTLELVIQVGRSVADQWLWVFCYIANTALKKDVAIFHCDSALFM